MRDVLREHGYAGEEGRDDGTHLCACTQRSANFYVCDSVRVLIAPTSAVPANWKLPLCFISLVSCPDAQPRSCFDYDWIQQCGVLYGCATSRFDLSKKDSRCVENEMVSLDLSLPR